MNPALSPLDAELRELRERRARTGLYFLLAVVTSLFLLLAIALVVRAQYGDWEPLGDPWQPLASPTGLWFNTALLLLASIILQAAVGRARRNQRGSALQLALVAGLLSTAFIGGQLWVWQNLMDNGLAVAGNPANSFFYLLTGLHGLHILGGLAAWGRLLLGATHLPTVQLGRRLQLCATYWHYLLGVWLLLFALLSGSAQTYRNIAAFCGF